MSGGPAISVVACPHELQRVSWAMYWVDTGIPNQALDTSRLVLSGTPSEMRTGLLAMATTVLATAGVVFTLLTLPLSTVASQYGSRLLRLFLGDRTTQWVLGMFVGTFVYCIAAALSIVPSAAQPEGPQLTVTIGLYLMLATFATLILLVQHVSTMLQAPNIAAAAGAKLMEVVRAESKDDSPGDGDGQDAPDTPGALQAGNTVMETAGDPVRARRAGYIQFVDPEIMLAVTQENDLAIRLLRKPGDFVGEGAVVALAWPASRVDQKLAAQIDRAFQIGNVRTPTQDVEYAVNLLVEMAVPRHVSGDQRPLHGHDLFGLHRPGPGALRPAGQESLPLLRSGWPASTGAGAGDLRRIAQRRLRHAPPCQLRQRQCPAAHAGGDRSVIGTEAQAPRLASNCFVTSASSRPESQAGALIEDDRQLIHRNAQALQSKLECVMRFGRRHVRLGCQL